MAAQRAERDDPPDGSKKGAQRAERDDPLQTGLKKWRPPQQNKKTSHGSGVGKNDGRRRLP